mgnify:CR=1 FL=1
MKKRILTVFVIAITAVQFGYSQEKKDTFVVQGTPGRHARHSAEPFAAGQPTKLFDQPSFY